MNTYRSLFRKGGAVGALACAAAVATAPPSSAAGTQSVRCVGDADSCVATVGIAGGATDKVVTVNLTDSDLQLVKVTALGALADRPYVITRAAKRLGGSQYRFTLTAAKENPKRARIVLQFAAGTSRQLPTGGGLLRSWRTEQAVFNVGAGMKVTIQGGGGRTSNCTRDETNDTFTTRGDGERHQYGFYSVGSGSCLYEMSWSNFNVTVKDQAGNTIGSGTFSYGQGETFGGYHASCRDPWSKGWRGSIGCDLTDGQITIERVY